MAWVTPGTKTHRVSVSTAAYSCAIAADEFFAEETALARYSEIFKVVVASVVYAKMFV